MIKWGRAKVETTAQVETTVENMPLDAVCDMLGIPPDHYQFAKAYRQGLVTEQVWIEKYLVSTMVLAVAVDELRDKIDKLLIRMGADGKIEAK